METPLAQRPQEPKMHLSILGAAALHIAGVLIAHQPHESAKDVSQPLDAWIEVDAAPELPLDHTVASAAESLEPSADRAHGSAPRTAPRTALAASSKILSQGDSTESDWLSGEGIDPLGSGDVFGARATSVRRGAHRSTGVGLVVEPEEVTGPQLLAASAACTDLFPHSAQTTHGEVAVTVDVDSQGKAHLLQIVRELPLGEGFATAARSCSARLRFAPALDGKGRAIHSQTKLKLTFDRPS